MYMEGFVPSNPGACGLGKARLYEPWGLGEGHRSNDYDPGFMFENDPGLGSGHRTDEWTGLGFSLPPIQGPDTMDPGSVDTGGIVDLAAEGLQFVPGVGTIAATALQVVNGIAQKLEQFFHFHAGSNEANVIVPIQNDLMGYLGKITDLIRVGQNPSVAQLQQLYQDVWYVGQQFKQFVGDTRFTDGRASQQALNTVMPYIDGTSGYHWPELQPTDSGTLAWGGGTIGGDGTTGMMGAIGRAIQARGGAVPMPSLTQGPGVPSLSYPTVGTPQLPQAGTIPIRPPVPAGPITISSAFGATQSSTIPLVIGAGLLIGLIARRGRK